MARIGGRQLGTPNRITTAFKDAVRIVYEDIGGHAAFATWARENPMEFYKIAARLIPTEIAARDGGGVTIIVDRAGALDVSREPDAVPMLSGHVER